MAEANMTMLTVADLGAKSPGIIIDAATGRKALTFAGVTPVEIGTTGDRDVTSLMSNITAGVVEIIRTGYDVTISFEGVKVGVATSTTLLAADTSNFIYTGFRPGTYNGMSGMLVKSNGPDVARVMVSRTGAITIYGAATTDTLFGTFHYTTQRAWPTSLPGTEGAMTA